MNLLDAALLAGFCLALGACALLIRAQLRDARKGVDGVRRAERLDMYMGAVWSGFVIVQASEIFHHVQPNGTFNLSPLSLAASAGDLLICGVFAGRLLLRRELRLQNARRADDLGASPT